MYARNRRNGTTARTAGRARAARRGAAVRPDAVRGGPNTGIRAEPSRLRSRRSRISDHTRHVHVHRTYNIAGMIRIRYESNYEYAPRQRRAGANGPRPCTRLTGHGAEPQTRGTVPTVQHVSSICQHTISPRTRNVQRGTREQCSQQGQLPTQHVHQDRAAFRRCVACEQRKRGEDQ